MATFRTAIESSLSEDEAFARMAAFERVPEWDPTVVEARRLTEGEPAVGTRFQVRSRFGGRVVDLEYGLVECDPPRSFTLEARNPSFRSRDVITVEPRAAGSIVRYEALLEFEGWRQALDPLLHALFGRVGRKAAAGLRRYLNP
jgi:hypothetical protein